MNCPIKMQPPPCCLGCAKKAFHWLTGKNRKRWSEEKGFWSEKGCRLNRKDMPSECKVYNCHQDSWVIRKKWDGEWKEYFVSGIPDGENLELVLVKGKKNGISV